MRGILWLLFLPFLFPVAIICALVLLPLRMVFGFMPNVAIRRHSSGFYGWRW